MEISRTYFITEEADGAKEFRTSPRHLSACVIFYKLKAHDDCKAGVMPISNLSKLSRDFGCSVSVIKKAISDLIKQGLIEPVTYSGKNALRMRNIHKADNYTRKKEVTDNEGKICYNVGLYFKMKKVIIKHRTYEELKLILMADVYKCSQNQQLYKVEHNASRVSKLVNRGLPYQHRSGSKKKRIMEIKIQEYNRTQTRRDAAAESLLVLTTDESFAYTFGISTPTANKYKRILHQKGHILACNVLVPVTNDLNCKLDDNAIKALKSLQIVPNRTHFENGIAVNLIGTTIIFPHDKKFRFENNGKIKRFFVNEVFEMIERANFETQYSDDFIENLKSVRNKVSYCYTDNSNRDIISNTNTIYNNIDTDRVGSGIGIESEDIWSNKPV
jgi:hypothetical protein